MDIEAEVNPLTKLRLYRVAKKIVFGKMDKKVITPERATEILNYVKEEVAYCDTPEDCHVFYKEVALEFPELADFQDKFERETYEKLDRALSILVEHIFAKGEFDLAERIMDEVEEIRFGFYGAILAQIMGLTAAFLNIKNEKRDSVRNFFSHPETATPLSDENQIVKNDNPPNEND